jgi:hypothetical protein
MDMVRRIAKDAVYVSDFVYRKVLSLITDSMPEMVVASKLASSSSLTTVSLALPLVVAPPGEKEAFDLQPSAASAANVSSVVLELRQRHTLQRRAAATKTALPESAPLLGTGNPLIVISTSEMVAAATARAKRQKKNKGGLLLLPNKRDDDANDEYVVPPRCWCFSLVHCVQRVHGKYRRVLD